MTPLDTLRALAAHAQAAKEAGQDTLAVDATTLAHAKQAVSAEASYPPDLADIPIFLDAKGLLTIAGVTLY